MLFLLKIKWVWCYENYRFIVWFGYLSIYEDSREYEDMEEGRKLIRGGKKNLIMFCFEFVN